MRGCSLRRAHCAPCGRAIAARARTADLPAMPNLLEIEPPELFDPIDSRTTGDESEHCGMAGVLFHLASCRTLATTSPSHSPHHPVRTYTSCLCCINFDVATLSSHHVAYCVAFSSSTRGCALGAAWLSVAALQRRWMLNSQRSGGHRRSETVAKFLICAHIYFICAACTPSAAAMFLCQINTEPQQHLC